MPRLRDRPGSVQVRTGQMTDVRLSWRVYIFGRGKRDSLSCGARTALELGSKLPALPSESTNLVAICTVATNYADGHVRVSLLGIIGVGTAS
jgi:hypothetical protein